MVDVECVGVACDRPMSANATVAKVVTQWSTEIRRSVLAKLFRCRSLSRIDYSGRRMAAKRLGASC